MIAPYQGRRQRKENRCAQPPRREIIRRRDLTSHQAKADLRQDQGRDPQKGQRGQGSAKVE